jgi:hypothetical protein
MNGIGSSSMTAEQFPTNPSVFPESSRALLSLAFGILGFATVGVFSPVAWSMGSRELAAIEEGRRSPDHRLLAQTARIIGIAGTAVVVIAASLFVLALVGIIEVT